MKLVKRKRIIFKIQFFFVEEKKMVRDLCLIVGLACAGKTTVANKIGGKVIHSDDLRYSDKQWTRRPLAEYRQKVREAIAAARSEPGVENIVFDSTCLDVNDPENARQIVLYELLEEACQVTVIEPDDIFTCVGRLIDRCINRSNGTDLGSCPETSKNRAHLLVEFITSFERASQALMAFKEKALELQKSTNGECLVTIGTFAEMMSDKSIF